MIPSQKIQPLLNQNDILYLKDALKFDLKDRDQIAIHIENVLTICTNNNKYY